MYKHVIAASAIAVTLVASAVSGVAQADPPPRNLTCKGTVEGGTYHHVRVPKGESCRIVDATVTGNLRARGADDVRVLDTEVRRNLMVIGATGSVKVGNKVGCRYDPVVGNNVVVRSSHNVLLCRLSLGNNLTVRENDGRITVRDNVVDNNVRVSRNKVFVADGPVGHGKPGAIRLIENAAGNHIQLFHNHDSRALVLRHNSPKPTVK